MQKSEASRLKAEGRIVDAVGLCRSYPFSRHIRLIPADRPPELPQMDTDLIRATSERANLEERCAIMKTLAHLKLSGRGETVVRVDRA